MNILYIMKVSMLTKWKKQNLTCDPHQKEKGKN